LSTAIDTNDSKERLHGRFITVCVSSVFLALSSILIDFPEIRTEVMTLMATECQWF
jgi:hypothetical protein